MMGEMMGERLWPRGDRPRRAVVVLFAFLLPALFIAALLVARPSEAGERRHGLSAFGELKYPPDFKHFDYVNPNAPKGGRLSMIGTAGVITFNSFNGYILKGDPAQGLGYLSDTMTIFDQLMVRAWDEPDAVYGLVAHSAEVADDKKSVTFYLRPEARFADGSPLTAEDVKFTLDILKAKGHPIYRLALKDVVGADVIDPYTIRYRFKGQALRDLPLIVATLPIFSKAYYSKHEFDRSTLEPPLGSGPYRIGDFKQGAFVTYVRRKDYWAKDLPVNRGRFNFDELRYEYFADRTAELEALFAGAYDLREEFTSRDWATKYDIEAVRTGKIIKEELPDLRPGGTQGFFINLRRKKFAHPKTRLALDYAFDFEWTNRQLFYGAYTRTESYFELSDMKAEGPPSAAELALLEPYRDQLPPEVFGPPYVPPKSDGSGKDRKNLRRARELLKEAGWRFENGGWVNRDGERLSIEFLIFAPTSERFISPYVRTLRRLGIDATIRRVDPAQYQQRQKSFDFDIIIQRYVMRLTPGVELRNFFGSAAADASGSNNLAGIKNPVVDALIEKVLAAKTRDELRTAARALDRVLRAGHYWVSHWYNDSHRLAYWNKFSRPPIKPRYHRGIIETWWYDAEKAAKLAAK